MASFTPRGLTKTFTFWQDREIRFDASPEVFELRPNAEEVLATFHHVEDTKGNNGMTGTLLVTNLRLIWWSARQRSVNLSIGFYCVLSTSVREAQSKLLGGDAESLFVSCKYGASRFMFVFTYAPKQPQQQPPRVGGSDSDGGSGSNKARLHTTVTAAWRAYDSTRIYREIRLRAAVISGGNLLLLDGERLLSKLPGVTNVSKDAGHAGTLITTTQRVAWFASATENFNVSIPFMQFTALRAQESKFGPVLVIETSRYAGNFVLGFRMDPAERLMIAYQEIASLWRTWTAKPLLGMRIDFAGADAAAAGGAEGENFENADGESVSVGGAGGKMGKPRVRDAAVDVLERAPGDAFAAYYADEGQKGADRRPVFDPTIGLAVEKLRKGVTLQELWSVTLS